jgi:hypothetical protein
MSGCATVTTRESMNLTDGLRMDQAAAAGVCKTIRSISWNMTFSDADFRALGRNNAQVVRSRDCQQVRAF